MRQQRPLHPPGRRAVQAHDADGHAAFPAPDHGRGPARCCGRHHGPDVRHPLAGTAEDARRQVVGPGRRRPAAQPHPARPAHGGRVGRPGIEGLRGGRLGRPARAQRPAAGAAGAAAARDGRGARRPVPARAHELAGPGTPGQHGRRVRRLDRRGKRQVGARGAPGRRQGRPLGVCAAERGIRAGRGQIAGSLALAQRVLSASCSPGRPCRPPPRG
mmetsp:Transcript_16304/g.63575  ORF Transcript_16304/g.63575 Transcript_16304/m.63575 type:complete len:216 (-) Transcript_16304:2251-2898(-)